MAVKVKRERPDQRRHHRVTAPLYVAVGEMRVRAADWSIGGFRVVDFPDELPVIGTPLSASLSLPFQGFEVSFDAKAEVVRLDPEDKGFGARFIDLGERERELMSHFLEELVRGSMSHIEDTIQRIDVPVTPASLEPDQPLRPSASVPLRRWPVKTLLMTGVYAAVGVVVFGYTALLGYTNFFRMEVQTAVISAPVETVTAQADGRVQLTQFKPGDTVKAGDVLINVLDNTLEREIELADIAVREQKAKLVYLKRRQADELERVHSFATVETKNVAQTRIDLESLQAQLGLAEQQLRRVTTLHEKGFATDQRREEAERQVVTLQKALENRKVELSSRADLAEQNFGKRLYTGENVVGELGAIEAQVRLAELEIELTQEKSRAFTNHRRRLDVRAPFDGTVLELPRFNDGQVRRGDVIAVVEQRTQRQVTAFLTQDEVLKIGLNDEATLYVPSLGKSVKARVSEIDRTSGFVREQEQRANPGYSWRGPTDRSARVTLKFENEAEVADDQTFRSGLPVVVVFPQRSSNAFLSSLKQRLSL